MERVFERMLEAARRAGAAAYLAYDGACDALTITTEPGGRPCFLVVTADPDGFVQLHWESCPDPHPLRELAS